MTTITIPETIGEIRNQLGQVEVTIRVSTTHRASLLAALYGYHGKDIRKTAKTSGYTVTQADFIVKTYLAAAPIPLPGQEIVLPKIDWSEENFAGNMGVGDVDRDDIRAEAAAIGVSPATLATVLQKSEKVMRAAVKLSPRAATAARAGLIDHAAEKIRKRQTNGTHERSIDFDSPDIDLDPDDALRAAESERAEADRARARRIRGAAANMAHAVNELLQEMAEATPAQKQAVWPLIRERVNNTREGLDIVEREGTGIDVNSVDIDDLITKLMSTESDGDN